ncbi:hypothetical protein I79_003826 [Cricetulus griseus]|uniref:Uncharacterized protein n=1 Tax=Cricetulus griseus TaxID=10029 RepID=G3H106_CRIGR|nr:hypothetical protein I79_003826 [Cricetulus griseus]
MRRVKNIQVIYLRVVWLACLQAQVLLFACSSMYLASNRRCMRLCYKSCTECLKHYKRQLPNLCIFGSFEEI